MRTESERERLRERSNLVVKEKRDTSKNRRENIVERYRGKSNRQSLYSSSRQTIRVVLLLESRAVGEREHKLKGTITASLNSLKTDGEGGAQ